MKKMFKVLLAMSFMALMLTGCCLKHEWKDATCELPKTCEKCGKTDGEALGHVWMDATCVDPETCERCGDIKGEALGHEWLDAVCLYPKTCKVCKEKEGEPLGHDWAEATCTSPKTCNNCNEKEGDPIDHNWLPATCTEKSKCADCGKTTGKTSEHTYEKNVCTACADIMIETYDELQRYLNKNYKELVTPVGTVKGIVYNIVVHDPPLYQSYDYELQIETDLWCKDSNASLYSLITRDYYTYEERLNALVTMLQFEREVAQIAMDAFPNKKVKGYFFDYGYEYPSIKVGYSSTKYFMFANFDGPINGYDYKSTTISDYHIDEIGGDQFVCSFHDNGNQLKKDAKKITGYDIEYSDRY